MAPWGKGGGCGNGGLILGRAYSSRPSPALTTIQIGRSRGKPFPGDGRGQPRAVFDLFDLPNPRHGNAFGKGSLGVYRKGAGSLSGLPVLKFLIFSRSDPSCTRIFWLKTATTQAVLISRLFRYLTGMMPKNGANNIPAAATCVT